MSLKIKITNVASEFRRFFFSFNQSQLAKMFQFQTKNAREIGITSRTLFLCLVLSLGLKIQVRKSHTTATHQGQLFQKMMRRLRFHLRLRLLMKVVKKVRKEKL